MTGLLVQPLSAGLADRVRAALATGDPGTLYALDHEFAPFYCPVCALSYCADHWDRCDVFDPDDPGWHDSIRGRCPRGHERMLED